MRAIFFPTPRSLYQNFLRETEGRPFLTALSIVYAIIPIFIVAVGTYAIIQREALNAEVRRNCLRSVAIANYIHDIVPPKPPKEKGPAVARILQLERELRSIGSCKSK